MKMIYTTACIFPDTSYIHFLRDSAVRFNVPLQPYGIGAQYIDWRDIKITKWLAAAKGWLDAGYSHCFYTDGRDSFLLTGAREIEYKYTIMGRPPYLSSAEDQPYPFMHLGPKFPDPGHPWRYIGAGQFICDIKYAVDMWEKLRRLYDNIPEENHDQGWQQLGYAEGHLDPGEFKLDYNCEIFQIASVDRQGGDIPNYVELNRLRILIGPWRPGRVYNPITKTYPCAIHFPGGYADPKTGKDSTLEPVWKALGFDVP